MVFYKYILCLFFPVLLHFWTSKIYRKSSVYLRINAPIDEHVRCAMQRNGRNIQCSNVYGNKTNAFIKSSWEKEKQMNKFRWHEDIDLKLNLVAPGTQKQVRVFFFVVWFNKYQTATKKISTTMKIKRTKKYLPTKLQSRKYTNGIVPLLCYLV